MYFLICPIKLYALFSSLCVLDMTPLYDIEYSYLTTNVSSILGKCGAHFIGTFTIVEVGTNSICFGGDSYVGQSHNVS